MYLFFLLFSCCFVKFVCMALVFYVCVGGGSMGQLNAVEVLGEVLGCMGLYQQLCVFLFCFDVLRIILLH